MELEKFVQATYTLEGESTLVFIAFEKLEELSAFIHVQNFPNLAQAIHNVAEQRRWYKCALGECLTPAFQYYSQTVINDLVVAYIFSKFKPLNTDFFHCPVSVQRGLTVCNIDQGQDGWNFFSHRQRKNEFNKNEKNTRLTMVATQNAEFASSCSLAE